MRSSYDPIRPHGSAAPTGLAPSSVTRPSPRPAGNPSSSWSTATARSRCARRRPLPAPPQWWIEYGIGARCTPARLHTGDCPMTGRARPSTAQSIRQIPLTVPGVVACPLCRPDNELGLLDS
ncbi:DUF6233 domain-containing protein [Streptomyces sp. NPDC054932]